MLAPARVNGLLLHLQPEPIQDVPFVAGERRSVDPFLETIQLSDERGAIRMCRLVNADQLILERLRSFAPGQVHLAQCKLPFERGTRAVCEPFLPQHGDIGRVGKQLQLTDPKVNRIPSDGRTQQVSRRVPDGAQWPADRPLNPAPRDLPKVQPAKGVGDCLAQLLLLAARAHQERNLEQDAAAANALDRDHRSD